MYRESLLGTALAITLEEIAPHLNEGQRERVWQVFDQTMEECLAEVPMMTRVIVNVPPPRPASLAKAARVEPASEVSTLITSTTTTSDVKLARGSAAVVVGEHPDDVNSSAGASSLDPLASAVSSSSNASASSPCSPLRLRELAEVAEDPQLAFPVYRCVDGRWTILLKDPEVRVRDESGKEEAVHLDYLKVYLQELTPSSSVTADQGVGRTANHRSRSSGAAKAGRGGAGVKGGKRPRS